MVFKTCHAKTMDTMNIKILGGGIAGLASALAVANTGGKATVFEKSAKFDPIGAGIQLGPNANRALQKLGAWDAIKPKTYAPPEIHMRDGRSGKILKRLVLGNTFEARYSMPYLTAHRADLHRALLEVAGSTSSIKIQSNFEVSDLTDQGFDGLIAADGVWSKTREKLFPGTKAIMTSDIYFRSLLAMPKNIGDIDFECVNLWLYPGGHIVHYPVGNPVQLNLIAITNGQEPKTFFKYASQSMQRVFALELEFTKWQSAYVAPLSKWSKGNITLIGDAAHATLPYLAQGAAMALEDAAELQRQLNCGLSFSEMSEKFYSNRIRRVTRLNSSSLRAGKIYHLKNPWALSRNLILRQLPTSIVQSQVDWIYKH